MSTANETWEWVNLSEVMDAMFWCHGAFDYLFCCPAGKFFFSYWFVRVDVPRNIAFIPF